ncbi:NAD+ synthase [Pseudobutyrivibrio sp. YE44]|uniref:NAD(+) synthase n=1 Tax=Pseudobutyrivibrio sp. YE44 TaxID=1520802 RepID=UPI0008920587|nr:NAD(+) synthase [Pseudobutyrivibrio sp. YE44]SDB35572.1 NAD+ synthase [Pseudobutyrivibrio sp. YE44]
MKNFNAKEVIEKDVTYLRNFFNGFSDKSIAVIGISGGKDSTVAAALLKEAIGADRVIGVMMPNTTQSDIEDSKKVCEFLGIRHTTVNIGEIFDAAKKTYEANDMISMTSQLLTNLAPRLRMATLYAVAQGQNAPAFVVNTCNRSEDYVGYSTKYGDAAGDVSVLQDLMVCEVRAIGDELGLPTDLVHKAPSDGLCGKTDEDNLGFTYAALDSYIQWLDDDKAGECPIEASLVEVIEKKHVANLHKLKTLPSFARQ